MVLNSTGIYVGNPSSTALDHGRFGNGWKAVPTHQPTTNLIQTTTTIYGTQILQVTQQQQHQQTDWMAYGNYQYQSLHCIHQLTTGPPT